MRTRSLVSALCGVAAALALLGAGCGGSDAGPASAESQTTAAVAAESSQAYRDELAAIVLGPDDARGNYHDALLGDETFASARELAGASRAAAREIDELTPPAALIDQNRELAARYRRWATAVERELARKPLSTARLGDAVREYGKAADDVYEQILVAP